MCPCPVWLIGRRLPARMPWRIVAAINPTHESPTEQQLNETVLEWALTLKDMGYLVNADGSIAANGPGTHNRLFSGSGEDADPPSVE